VRREVSDALTRSPDARMRRESLESTLAALEREFKRCMDNKWSKSAGSTQPSILRKFEFVTAFMEQCPTRSGKLFDMYWDALVRRWHCDYKAWTEATCETLGKTDASVDRAAKNLAPLKGLWRLWPSSWICPRRVA